MAEVIGEVVLLVDLAGRPRFWLLRREESADVEAMMPVSLLFIRGWARRSSPVTPN